MTHIVLDIPDCRKCPNVQEERTKGAGFAFDYFCILKNLKKIMEYVEWSDDVKPVPEWCPILLKNLKNND